ncbi:hypothetical protein R9X47_00150 [Wukongibacter baidiensis]|uniref:hypothetical protein n=1 Tax=Wukongibacter baidiensis TaxID=1723361 RepID=UPI003D7FCE26
MIKKEVIISGHFELLALHKALMEAKFHTYPENLLISGSPFIADICNRVVDALTEVESQKNPSKREGWTQWRDVKNENYLGGVRLSMHANLKVGINILMKRKRSM